jgi:hypothetical protein
MIGETLGMLPTGSLVGMLITGKIELLSVAAPNREYDLVDNQLFMIFTLIFHCRLINHHLLLDVSEYLAESQNQNHFFHLSV